MDIYQVRALRWYWQNVCRPHSAKTYGRSTPTTDVNTDPTKLLGVPTGRTMTREQAFGKPRSFAF